MPHGPWTNKLNMIGQVVLVVAVALLIVRIIGWIAPNPALEKFFIGGKDNYKWIVDVFLAGAVGYGFYFWYSGRVWCRWMCPLAALMHVYARLQPLSHSVRQEKVHLVQRLHFRVPSGH